MRALRLARVCYRRVLRLPVSLGLRCLARGRHNGARHPLGGRRCRDCGLAGSDFADLNELHGSGRVSPLRKLFTREHGGTVTRSDEWGSR